MPHRTFTTTQNKLDHVMMRLYLGGSFDPVHDGHLDMIRHVAHRLSSYDFTRSNPPSLYFLPTAGNPFKGKSADPLHRLAMLSLACQILRDENINVAICPLEIHETPPIYTVDTVQTLAKNHPDDERIFIMGGDSLVSLPRWKSYQEIFGLIKIWSFARARVIDDIPHEVSVRMTTDFDEFLKRGHSTIFYDTTSVRDISSSHIRATIKEGRVPPHLPKPILDYIKQHELYKDML